MYAEIVLKGGGTVRTQTVLAPKGHWKNPLSTAEIVDRYRDCVSHGPMHLPPERTEQAKDMILRLEEVPDATAIIRLLTI